MSQNVPSTLRDQPRPDSNARLRAQIVSPAQRHRRYNTGMVDLKDRQAGEIVNYKRNVMSIVTERSMGATPQGSHR